MNMKKSLLILAAVFAAAPLLAEKNDKMEPWQDTGMFKENRLPMAATFVTDQQKTLTFNGVWKFKWNETIETRKRLRGGRLRRFRLGDHPSPRNVGT